MKQLEKVYDPKQVEDKIYRMWNDGGYFTGVIDPDKKPFTIVIPPPNVTGELHLGHAFNNTLQDILIRFKRMQGYSALWLPGTDHAGIATQVRVEEVLRGEGLSRYDLGREEFLKRVWAWKNTYGSRIIEQLKKLGSSCDWTRERFTMDEGLSRAVREVFVDLYEKGLVYKGSRIINWCPKCATALSDAEVEHKEHAGQLYYIRYPVTGSAEHLIVATTRPETMLGDTGLAVHPEDGRYKHLIGKTAVLPLIGRELPIIADEYVDMDFGTGCVKMTPCHDPNDFEVGLKHGLEQVLVIDESAKIINAGKYNGLDRYDARREVLADLEALGLLEKTADHSLNIGSCYRCDTTVEPVTSAQWFVRMKPLVKDAIGVVEDGTIKFVPERFAKIYTHWMENVRDWCISRQLWWGHRIPAWYCECGHITVSREDPDRCGKCGSTDITRDEDVLDTWFSSALWPFSTLGWPDKTADLEYYYPTDVLVTAYDIIFFWVARMIFSGMEQMKREPFHTVFINGIIRDSEGRKMSKSLGNGIDPIEMIDRYGADALRFNIISGNSPGNDTRFYPERCEAMRNFANKIWNASRFVLMNLADGQGAADEEYQIGTLPPGPANLAGGRGDADEEYQIGTLPPGPANLADGQGVADGEYQIGTLPPGPANLADGQGAADEEYQIGTLPPGGDANFLRDRGLPDKLELEDKWVLSKLNTLALEMSENLEKYEIGVAAAKIYDFIWDIYCDWYIELTKPRLAGGAERRKAESGTPGAEMENAGAVNASNESADESAANASNENADESAANAKKVLLYVLTETLTLLHPFMPFITEEIYQALRGNAALSSPRAPLSSLSATHSAPCTPPPSLNAHPALMVRPYTKYMDALNFPKEEADFESVMAAIRAVRARRAEMNVPPSKKPSLIIVTDKPEVFEAGRVYIGRLAYAGALTVTDNAPGDLSGFVTVVTNDARLYIPLAELVDVGKERARIAKEIEKAKAEIARVGQKLSNEQFISKAPESVVMSERDKLGKLQALMDNLNDSLNSLP